MFKTAGADQSTMKAYDLQLQDLEASKRSPRDLELRKYGREEMQAGNQLPAVIGQGFKTDSHPLTTTVMCKTTGAHQSTMKACDLKLQQLEMPKQARHLKLRKLEREEMQPENQLPFMIGHGLGLICGSVIGLFYEKKCCCKNCGWSNE